MRKFSIELKWALIFIAMSLVWMLLERLVGLHGPYIDKHPVYTNLIAIPAIAVYVFALLDKRRNHYAGAMTYLQGLGSGLAITLVVTVASPLTQLVTSLLITPEYFPNAIANAVAAGKLSLNEAESYFSLGSYIVQGLIGAPIMGILTSAVVALFTRKKAK